MATTQIPERADAAKGHIYMMGSHYTKEPGDVPDGYNKFREDEFSRFLFTYRRGFQAIGSTNITSDRGWGCMLRTSQMMLGETFSRLFLGRGYRISPTELPECPRALWIIRMFLDYPNKPFSLQRISIRGEKYDKKIGSWFGPTNAGFVMRDLLRALDSEHLPVRAITFSNSIIYIDEVERIARRRWKNESNPTSSLLPNVEVPLENLTPLPPYTPVDGVAPPIEQVLSMISEAPQRAVSPTPSTSSDSDGTGAGEPATDYFIPMLLLIPCRLSMGHPTKEHEQPLRHLLSMPWSVGIVGGKPNASYWFYATRESNVYYKNPHDTQSTIPEPGPSESYKTDTYHGGRFHQKMDIKKLDPSMCFGFFFPFRSDWNSFVQEIKDMGSDMPFFSIEEVRPKFVPKDSGRFEL
ncbi:putative cysteine protease ATG4B [Blattamonas nauphoetae]|uniref:Cysteine protease n=1 Tax=Blattamonas nauphoetae TaxID=2049346 RepID=A0ABQ9XQ53_9EUKA|nr:putative cysteine protease ATG4B [Blattamonas nauphoetae]